MKPVREKDKKYLDFIKAQPCIACGRNGGVNDPHHWNKPGKSGMGTKCSDYRAVPLCHWHHDLFHIAGRTSFLERTSMEPEDIENHIERLNDKYKAL